MIVWKEALQTLCSSYIQVHNEEKNQEIKEDDKIKECFGLIFCITKTENKKKGRGGGFRFVMDFFFKKEL